MDVVTIFTILGGLSGFAALVVALFARHDSRKSNEIAHGSKEALHDSECVADHEVGLGVAQHVGALAGTR